MAFETLVRPSEMPGQSAFFPALTWPYVEGLRLDEAMNPLTNLATGLYGEEMPKQNGAPIRLVVPWKYGFKSIKSIVRMSLVAEQPQTTWNMLQPSEYGFYSNVNPQVDHPRWSQASERRIGEFAKRETLMFNGYADAVASLYTGMDLAREAKSMRPSLPVLIVSGAILDPAQLELMRIRNWNFLPKPFSLPKLLSEVHRILDISHSPLSATLSA